jgi:ferredoxin
MKEPGMSMYRFHVFSGTGNSMHLSRVVASRIEEPDRGAGGGRRSEIVEVDETEIARLRSGEGRSPLREEGDLDAFLFPVFAMSLPRIMRRYIRALGAARSISPGGARPRAAVLSTNGRISLEVRDGHEGQALAQAERMLRRRGWDVAYRDTFDYPQSISSILKIQDEGRRASIMALVEPRIDELVAELSTGKRRRRPCRAWAQILGWPFGWLYSILGRRFLAMLYAADGSCDGCGLCASRCPARAIRMRGRVPDWSYACEGCERCINLCPKEAIQASFLRVAVVFAICAAVELCPLKPALAQSLAFAPGWAFRAGWFVLSLVLSFAGLRLVDLGLVALARFQRLRPLLSFGWTKWTGRYRAPRQSKEGAKA